jgi:hypothetical protein
LARLAPSTRGIWAVTDQLKVDTPTLIEAGHKLRVVATEFHGAHTNADRVAAAVGHDELADAIHHFERNWDGKREKMLEHIGSLADQCQGVGEQFESLDSEFVKALRGEQ